MHHSYNQIQRCKIQHICNVIQNVKGNAGAMKYNDIKCNAGAIENVLSGILAAAVEPVYRPTLRLLVFVNHNITIMLHLNLLIVATDVSKKVSFAELSICRLEFKPVVGNPSLKIVFWSFFTKTKRDQAFPSPVDAKIWPHSLQF